MDLHSDSHDVRHILSFSPGTQCLFTRLPRQYRCLRVVDKCGTPRFGIWGFSSDLFWGKKGLVGAVSYISELLPKSPHWLVHLIHSFLYFISVSNCFFLFFFSLWQTPRGPSVSRLGAGAAVGFFEAGAEAGAGAMLQGVPKAAGSGRKKLRGPSCPTARLTAERKLTMAQGVHQVPVRFQSQPGHNAISFKVSNEKCL